MQKMTKQEKIFFNFFKPLKAGEHNICCALKLLLPAAATFIKQLFINIKPAETPVNTIVSANQLFNKQSIIKKAVAIAAHETV